ncbi:MAG: T9SS type A sorting domain-containing protein [Ferruginibacter sp.]|nr:T9SS type A sorting domain-containing protein [Ferruginibacter sp.]
MKIFYTGVLALLFYFNSNATTWTVTVANYSFSPSTVNAVVGDVIQFNWSSGFHTTTCGSGLPGTSLPAGAQEWDSPMIPGDETFSYTVTVAGNYLYGCIPHFSGMQGTIIVSSTLAVSFGPFTVLNNNNTALLQWKTLSEVNTDYFSIRKSTDAIHFYEIARANAAGNSNVTAAYQFADNDLGETYKYLYYEIVTVDKDKKESFSPIKTIRNNRIIKDKLIVALSPNPVTRPGQVQIRFNADKRDDMDVSVINSAGKLVLKTKMAAFYGLNNSHLHICDLEKGIYYIRFSLAGKTETKKVAVL